MSVSSMTNIAVARRTDDLGIGKIPKTPKEIARATGGNDRTESQLTAALKNIAGYIPTEVIALYLAALAAVRNSVSPVADPDLAARAGTITSPANSEVGTLIVFIILTPIFVWLVYAGRVRTAGKSLPLTPATWPIWEMFAATAAFVAWAFTLP